MLYYICKTSRNTTVTCKAGIIRCKNGYKHFNRFVVTHEDKIILVKKPHISLRQPLLLAYRFALMHRYGLLG